MIKHTFNLSMVLISLMIFNFTGCSDGSSGGSSGVNPKDSEAPLIPVNVSATAVSSSQIDLSWSASSDNVGVTAYTITRSDQQTFTSASTSWSDTGLNPNTRYAYSITASDTAGNTSGASSEVDATTEALDTETPTIPENLTATAISAVQINLIWNAASDNVGVTLYTLTRNDGQTFTATTTSYSNTGLSSGTSYTYTITASDAAGNISAPSGSAGAATPESTVINLPVIADNSIIDNRDERSMNRGGLSSLRIKAYQHHLILDADTTAINGRKVVGATLRYAQNRETLEHVTVSSIQGDWVEGTSVGFATEEGSSCFLAAEYHANNETLVPWSFPGSRYVDVVYGNGHSLMGFSDSPQTGLYYEWTVPADIVNAMAVGASYGIAVFESSHLVGRNPTVYSRESGNPPELVVTTEIGDPAPLAVINLTATTTGVDRGQAKLIWTVPENTFAYTLSIQGGTFTTPTLVPRYLIPFAGTAGASQEIVLKDILSPGTTYTLSMTAVARGGAQSPAQQISLAASNIDNYPYDSVSVAEPVSAGTGFSSGGLAVFAIPVTDKILPDGQLVETVPGNYATQNAVFNGAEITLRGGLNDMLAFQLVMKDSGSELSNISINAQLPTISTRPVPSLN